MEILRKNQKEILDPIFEEKKTRLKENVTEMKDVFDGLNSRLDMDEERISELEDISIDSSKTKKQREQKLKKQKRKSKDCGKTFF